MTTPAQHWRDELAAWAIPEPILAGATESPWALPTGVFVRRTERYLAEPVGPSYARAREALVPLGRVLDVGAGAGAASLPLSAWATQLIAVDEKQEMLDAMAAQARARQVPVTCLAGRWPDVAAQVPRADVVVCHHVFYNVADLPEFARELDDHAERRVVVELTRRHPLVSLNPLWMKFHGLVRPTGPSADDAMAVLAGTGITAHREDWLRPPAPSYATFDALVEATRRRLCLPRERAGEVADALAEIGVDEHNRLDGCPAGDELTTLWWDAG